MKNNKLIAKFMGEWKVHIGKFIAKVHGGWWDEYRLQYDSSWEWLMEAVCKITQSINGLDLESVEYKRFEEIFDIDTTLSAFMNNDIGDIYERCVEYIKWYNQQKEKEKK